MPTSYTVLKKKLKIILKKCAKFKILDVGPGKEHILPS
jgi:hypothetical protein